MALVALAFSGCGLPHPALEGAAPDARSSTQAYNPLAPLRTAPRGIDRVKRLPGSDVRGRIVVAATAEDTADAQVQAALRLSGAADELAIAFTRPLQHAVLYVRYDGRKEHMASAVVTPGRHISLVHEVEAGLLSVALAATTGQGLATHDVQVRLRFAPGASTTVRSTKLITRNPRSLVTDVTAVDNGDASATVQWSERHPGDFDLNGEVNGADLTKIGQQFMKTYTASSADYAKLEVIDGDANGEVNGSDITVIGQNFRSFITGYNVYRTPLATPDEVPLSTDTARWTKVDNIAEPAGPSAPRQYNGQDFRLVYTFVDASGEGDFGWFVRPTDDTGAEGLDSNVITLDVDPIAPPDAGLSFEIQPPAGGTVSPGDDLYVAVKVTGAAGLFSANVRFEYDTSILQFVEVLPAYNDGTDHPNLLSPPLFIGADNVGTATAPYSLVGFNATQTLGTPAVTADGALGYIHFTATGDGINPEAVRFPQTSNYIYLWGEQYGVPVLTPALGAPLQIAVVP